MIAGAMRRTPAHDTEKQVCSSSEPSDWATFLCTSGLGEGTLIGPLQEWRRLWWLAPARQGEALVQSQE
jgi:hypothetical protein